MPDSSSSIDSVLGNSLISIIGTLGDVVVMVGIDIAPSDVFDSNNGTESFFIEKENSILKRWKQHLLLS